LHKKERLFSTKEISEKHANAPKNKPHLRVFTYISEKYTVAFVLNILAPCFLNIKNVRAYDISLKAIVIL